MSSTYSIHCLGSKPISPFVVNREYFLNLSNQKDKLLKATAFEENFQILLDNYLEFEKSLLCYSMDGMVRETHVVFNGSDDFHNFNRLLLNLLSTARFYLDFITRNVSEFEVYVPGIRQEIIQLTHKQYDDRLGYRVMEALRNYSQHKGLPMQGMYLNSESTSADDRRVWRFRTYPTLLVATLAEDSDFKASIIQELSKKGESFSILPLIRDYISGIWEVHVSLRNVLSETVRGLTKSILDSIISSSQTVGEECKAFMLIRSDPETGEYLRIEIFSGLVERINKLIKRNFIFTGMEFRYVSNESLSSDK